MTALLAVVEVALIRSTNRRGFRCVAVNAADVEESRYLGMVPKRVKLAAVGAATGLIITGDELPCTLVVCAVGRRQIQAPHFDEP